MHTYVQLCMLLIILSITVYLSIYLSLFFSSLLLSFLYACSFVVHLPLTSFLSVAIALIKQIRAMVRVIMAGFVANSSWLKLIISLVSTVLFCCMKMMCTRVIVGCIKKSKVTWRFAGGHQLVLAERKWTNIRKSSSKLVRTRKSPCGCVILVFVARSK